MAMSSIYETNSPIIVRYGNIDANRPDNIRVTHV